MIEAIKAIGAGKAINLAGIERVRQRIAEIEKRFGIAGENSFQATLEREMKRAQQADRAQAAGKTHKATPATPVGASDVAAGPNPAVNNREAELVSEFDDLEAALMEEPELRSSDLVEAFNPSAPTADYPSLGDEPVNPFAAAAEAANPTPTPNTVRDPIVEPVVEGAVASVPSTTEEILEAAAAKYNVDPDLVKAIAAAESDWDQNAISSVGAIGVMQLMPETAAALGVNPYDENENIEGGAKYIRQMLDTFDGNVRKAVAAYNAGPNAVKRYGGVPPYAETQHYVGRVLDLYE